MIPSDERNGRPVFGMDAEDSQDSRRLDCEQCKARSRFLTDVSHELQTPIAILKGNMEMLRNGEVSKREMLRALRTADTTIENMSALVTHLLDVGRLNIFKHAIREAEIDIEKLLQEVCDDCFVLAMHKGVRLIVSAQSFFVGGDRRKLKEVFLNLVSNALKHTGKGGRIVLTAKRSTKMGVVTVHDNGSGIAPEHMKMIFERFYHIPAKHDPAMPAGRTDVRTGTGIGLSICKQIIEAHDGTIEARSKLGKGSRFVIRLPVLSGGRLKKRKNAQTPNMQSVLEKVYNK